MAHPQGKQQLDTWTSRELPGALVSEAECELERIVGDFEDRWAAGQKPRIEDYLESADLVDRDVLLIELVHVDIERRLCAQQPVSLDDYLRRFPSLDQNRAVRNELQAKCRSRSSADTLAPADKTASDRPSQATDFYSVELPRLPGFEVLRELGRGGMGTVYEAWQPSLHRHVAIKMVERDRRYAAELAARLKNEARSVAALQHPHIVAVYEVGEYQGRPYLVMEHLAGGNLQERLAQGPLAPRDAAELALKLAAAMQRAHAARLVHRDLKPANILFAADGTPKISDFGLARNLADDVGLTLTGDILGTPYYMAPEQVRGDTAVGPAADVFALGGVLYSAMTAARPFPGISIHEVLLQVANEPPIAPRSHVPSIPRDLETICLKCLEKLPERRYASMELLAADLRRFLRGQTVLARRAGPLLRLSNWAQRNRSIAALLATIAALLIGTAALSTAAAVRIDRARELANERAQAERQARAEAEQLRAQSEAERAILAEREEELSKNAYASAIQLAHIGIRQGQTPSARPYLHEARQLVETKGVPPFELRYLKSQYAGPYRYDTGESGRVLSLHFTPDYRLLLGGTVDGVLHIWDAASRELVQRFQAHDKCVNTLLFSADGSLLVTSSCDKSVRVWNTSDWSCRLTLETQAVEVDGCAISDCGEILATATLDLQHKIPAQYSLWRLSTGELLRSWSGTSVGIKSLYFADGDQTLISGGYDGLMERWDLSQDPPVPSPLLPDTAPPLRKQFNALWRSPDRDTYACVGISRGKLCVVLYHAATGDVRLVEGVEPQRCEIGFSPDGRLLATAGQGDVIQVYDLELNRTLLRTRSYTLIESVAFRDNNTFVTGHGSGPVFGHDIGAHTFAIPASVDASAYDPVSNRLFVPTEEHYIAAFDLDTTLEQNRWPIDSTQHIQQLSMAGASRLLIVGETKIQLFNLDNSLPDWEIDVPRVDLCTSTPDGQLIAWTENDVLKLANTHTNTILWEQSVTGIGAFNDLTLLPDGRVILTGQLKIRQFDCQTGESAPYATGALQFRYFASAPSQNAGEPASSLALVFHTATYIGELDYHTGDRESRLFGHESWIVDACYSPDGRTLASIDQSGSLRLWMTSTHRPLCELARLEFRPNGCQFSADGRRLVVWSAKSSKNMIHVRIFRTE